MEKVVVNKIASEQRTEEVIKSVYHKAKIYANKGFDKFSITVYCTKNEFWNASLSLNDLGIFIDNNNDGYEHNNELGDKSSVTANFIIK